MPVLTGTDLSQEEVDFLTERGIQLVHRVPRTIPVATDWPSGLEIRINLDAYPQKVNSVAPDFHFPARGTKNCRRKTSSSMECLKRLQLARTSTMMLTGSWSVPKAAGLEKAFAAAGIHNTLKLDLLRAHYDDVAMKAEKAPSCFQKCIDEEDAFSMYIDKDTFSRDSNTLSDWEILNCPWWIEQRSETPVFVADAETFCWKKLQKKEDPFDVSKDKFEDSDEKGKLEEARLLEPSPNIDGLVIDTSRTKKQKEAKMKNPRSEDVDDADGQTPKGKSKPAKNPGSGRSSKAKKGKEKEKETPKETTKKVTKEKGRKKKDQSDDEAGQGSQQQPASNDAMEIQPDSATPTVDEDQPEPTAAAWEEGRQRKRAKKQSDGVRVYEGLFRVDQYVDIPNQFAVLKSSLKSTFETIQANKNRAKKMLVPIIDELKKTCTAVAPMRMSGFLLNGKQSSFAAYCLYLDLPSGLNLEVDDNGPLL
ncbi:hypothetical protein R1sor_022668 [Riccia sorocarpa]|uniref:Uncharacterized protein n=1 Tax=Riccia sorocarpa TaxID=122646 RepID=A0ABD3GKG6_9MARC